MFGRNPEWRKVSLLVLVLAILAACAGAISFDRNSGAVQFRELSFELPGGPWKSIGAPGKATFQDEYGPGAFRNLAVWEGNVPPGRPKTRQAATRSVFSLERAEPRNGRWSYQETSRLVGGQMHPVMSFSDTESFSGELKGMKTEGLFLLFYPQDFEERGRFYVVMRWDLHPRNEAGTGLSDVNAIVSTFRIAAQE